MLNELLYTSPKFDIAPEKSWLEDYFHFGVVYFQGLCCTSGGYIFCLQEDPN